ncbi:TPA: IdeS/Mac family cysteine endopeptidase [Streptococcus suis]|nr:IdeS/Mac family cysteine endopeptidase [Streptococcus suis]
MGIHIRFSLRKLAVGLVPVAFLFLTNQFTLSAKAEMISALEGEAVQVEGGLVPQSLEIIEEAEEEQENDGALTGLNILVGSENLAQASENEVAPSEQENELLEPNVDQLLDPTSIEIHADLETMVIPEHEDSSLPSNLPVAVQKDVVEQPISLYTSEDGQYREIIWAQGITPPSMGQGGDFKKEVTGEFIEYTMPYEAGKGYYDANKSLDASLEDLNLCFAAVSSNMLHWWLEQNGPYVQRFIEEKYGSVENQQDYPLTDVRRYPNSFEDQQNSRIFNFFKTYYGHRLNGFVSDALVDLFINGYSPKNHGGVNLENPDLVPDKRGGFFHEVFHEKKLTDRMFSGDYRYFGNLVRTNLENQSLLGLSYRTFGTTTHIVTVWGAEYDDKGQIRAVYITDSDDQHGPIGLKRMGITRDTSGNPRLNNNVVRNSFGSHLDYVHTINLGRKHWETYFNGLEDEKQTARQKLSEAKLVLHQAIRDQEGFSEKEERSYIALIEETYLEGLEQINQVREKQELSEILQSALQSLQELAQEHLVAKSSSVFRLLPVGELTDKGSSLRYNLPVGQLSVKGSSVSHSLPVGELFVKGSSVSHSLPVGEISVKGSSVSHSLPVGELFSKGSSVSHSLPVGELFAKGSSVSHGLPVGEISVKGSSVSHSLPVGEIFTKGSSVSHSLPVGEISVKGSSVSHSLPVGEIFVKGSSVSHSLPVGELFVKGPSVSHSLPVGELFVKGSSVSHSLPVGELFVKGPSVSHSLPVGELFVKGSSVSHSLPVWEISVKGSSVSHSLPVGEIFTKGSSVSHSLPVGEISVKGPSVSHSLPVGEFSVKGSSVSHSLPVGELFIKDTSVSFLSEKVLVEDLISLEEWSVESEESWLGTQQVETIHSDRNILTSPIDEPVGNQMKNEGEPHALDYSSEVMLEGGIAETKKVDTSENDVSSKQKEERFGLATAKELLRTVMAGENELVSLPNLVVIVLLVTTIISYWLLASSIFKRD